WRASSDLNGIWMTAYVLPAFSGQVLPYPQVPVTAIAAEPPPCTELEPTPQAPTENPLGGGTAAPAGGVGAGGGGEGAPDFSRPAPASKGKTPGGARVRHHAKGEKASDHARTRRGENLHQARGTETAEPRRGAEARQEVEEVSAGTTPSTAAGEAGGDGDEGRGPGERAAPLPAAGAKRANATTTGEEVSGIVIGSPEGRKGKLAFGAPGLRSAARGGPEEPWGPLAIAGGGLVLLGLGARRGLRC